ncbi:hypothetical protein QC999_gp21 [Microbacterium phage Cressida]|uniref:Uncharacterized protein n=1 Tax=Microbacterium phage Cressida TaxID=2591216 RepID=A0A514DI88_9CAUD|nr:hypothetical protein QC999_gp21 [Microbacterium phage Cressida]QDH93329.1 hypothetical protein PBI_CRESSIDA_87 [Microbacterium phage Cressida]
MTVREECGNTIGIRYPDAPADQWETAACIQTHDAAPGTERMIHDSGDGWKWMLLDGFAEEAALVIHSIGLKGLRETLCQAQSALQAMLPPNADEYEVGRHLTDLDRIQRLIAEIDRNRPLGADGKHGDLHTPTCGCDDR